MIQRIQSIFLAVIIILSVLMMVMPFETIQAGNSELPLTLMPGHVPQGIKSLIVVPAIINIAVALLALICIFLYTKRKLQMKLCIVIVALSAGLISNVLPIDFRSHGLEASEVYRKAAACFPAINVVLAVLARRGIKKDEELVRSADRIR